MGEGLQNGRGGGQVKFYPYKKGAETVLAMLKWRLKKVLGRSTIVFTQELEVLATGLDLLERGGGRKDCLKGGGARKVSDPRFSHFALKQICRQKKLMSLILSTF